MYLYLIRMSSFFFSVSVSSFSNRESLNRGEGGGGAWFGKSMLNRWFIFLFIFPLPILGFLVNSPNSVRATRNIANNALEQVGPVANVVSKRITQTARDTMIMWQKTGKKEVYEMVTKTQKVSLCVRLVPAGGGAGGGLLSFAFDWH